MPCERGRCNTVFYATISPEYADSAEYAEYACDPQTVVPGRYP
jgi:hypothetical protein